MRFILSIIIGMIIPLKLTAQDFNYSGASSLALGDIRSVERNIYSSFSNPAGATAIVSPGISFSYINPYNIQKLSNRSLAATLPTKFGHFSVIYSQSGFSLSLMHRYGFSYARTFGKYVSAALEFNGITHKIAGTEKQSGFFATTGIQFFPSKKTELGFYIQNPEQSKIDYNNQRVLIPVLYIAGLKWKPLNTLSLMVEMEKNQQYSPQYKFGIEYFPVEILALLGGVKGSPADLSFGTGIKWKFMKIDIAISYHQQLGVTSGLSIAILPQKK